MNTKNNEVVNDLLGYEGLKIIQRPDMFNFSLDSTILAYYVSINKTTKKIIDLGCGNGYIPIFLSLRTNALIHGVEIQEESYDLATRSVALNNLNNQINIYLGDMKEIHKELGVAQYDVVTSNPPYFIYKEESLINANDYLTIARHEVKVTLDEVVHSANVLLKDGGTFAMVHRVERLMDILESFRKNKIEPKRILFVYPKITSEEALVVFIEGKKSNKKGGLKILPPLYVYNEENKYTDEILKIFNYKKED
jgi:tRNA1(Val) A37 N6-methylase TrmN6